MNNAVIYARVSSKEQEAEGFSIPAQIKALQDYALKNRFTVAQTFTDTETARVIGRTEFNEMLLFLQKNKLVQHVLVEKADRLSRNFDDLALIKKLVKNTNLHIHFVKDCFIFSKASRANDKLGLNLRMLMAEHYVDNLSEEVTKGMNEKAYQGTYPSGAPYGYVNIRKNGQSTIEVDPVAAAHVKKMYELYAMGSYGLKTLRAKLIADGMIYKDGKPFYTSKLEKILKNDFYVGKFTWNGIRCEKASHEPLVSMELFRRVQSILTYPAKSKSRKDLFPFTNLISCGQCGCKFTAELKKEKYIYYKCTGSSKTPCKNDYLKQEAIDNLFANLFSRIHISCEVETLIMSGLKESMKDKIEYHNNLIEELGQQIKRLQKRLDNTYQDKVDEVITFEEWKRNADVWSAQKEDLSIKMFAAQKADIHYFDNAQTIIELCKNASGMFKSANVTKKRNLLNMLTSNCIYKDGNIDVELKPVFGMVLKSVETESWCAR